jgi:4-hydroxythreonine-4-phosphate dehydrogenase
MSSAVMHELPIVVAVGDPAGIGPEVSVRSALKFAASVPVVLFGDAEQLAALAAREQRTLLPLDGTRIPLLPLGQIGVVDTGRVAPEIVARHAASAESGHAQLTTLREAADFVRAGRGRALVTGPTSKAAIVRAGHRFVGQTEFLAGLSGLSDDAVTMMFLGPRLRVALVTTHLAIADAPKAITRARVQRTVRHLAEVLERLAKGRTPTLVVAGLNPHAGEEGLFGREELDVIGPALAELAADARFAEQRVLLRGPEPAESVFRAAHRGDIEGVVAMIHDQATIASKLLDWGAAVNTTWGLPFVRTSVDHGVAYDAARAGKAEADGMHAALALAIALTGGEHGGAP